MATIGGMAAVFVVSAPRSLPAPAVAVAVYHIEAQGRLREMLLNPAASSEAAPLFVFHVYTPEAAPTAPGTFPP